jgi:Tfp pilus assembly protein PilW
MKLFQQSCSATSGSIPQTPERAPGPPAWAGSAAGHSVAAGLGVSSAASSTPSRRWGSASVSVAEIVRRVAANDPGLLVVDVSNSAIFQTRSDEYTAQVPTFYVPSLNPLPQTPHLSQPPSISAAKFGFAQRMAHVCAMYVLGRRRFVVCM